VPCKRRSYRRKASLDDLTKLTIDASEMLILTSGALAVSTGVSKALKKVSA